ncbi:MAG: lysine-sensitive aspartokinase 3 [Acidobacteria bacterium]|nr:MAG: lysine-sensitive aspartokinase 3 [Acidobacteriota bacterium]
MIVMKFGGTSVESTDAIERVARIVSSRLKRSPVVVVSAMAKVTDQLVAMGNQAAAGDCNAAIELLQALRERHLQTARELLGSKRGASLAPRLEGYFSELENFLRGLAAVRELTPRGSDYLLSFGELLSSVIVADAFAVRGLNAAWVDSRQCLVTDANHTRAVPQMKQTRERCKNKLVPLVSKKRIAVMGGFIAATENGVPTTLGRGGSDYSAAIIGAAVDADCIEIWTDVEGMMTTDPRLCPDAKTIKRISFNEAAELAYFGAKVLHPATLLSAIHQNIPVYVLNSRNLKSTGTEITAQAPPSRDTFRAITAKNGISIVNVVASRGVMVHGFLRSVFEALDRHSSPVDIVAISEVSMSFTMETKRLPKALLSELEQIADLAREDRQAIICLVGEDIHGKPGIAASVFNTIAKADVNIRMISQGASEINISFVIQENDVPKAVRHLHAQFFPGRTARKIATAKKSGTTNGLGRRRTKGTEISGVHETRASNGRAAAASRP